MTTIDLRPETPLDEALLRRIYASTREEELGAVSWEPEAKDAFLRMQFDLQHEAYHSTWPSASFDVIVVNGSGAGRFYVYRGPEEIRVIDIALLPTHRGHGIGTALLQPVLDEARDRGVPVTMHVERSNPARRLYERLGFEAVDDGPVYLRMESTVPT